MAATVLPNVVVARCRRYVCEVQSQYWDRLTASLAVVEIRDLETVWGFLSHAGVIEHDRRGAFDQVINAITSELDRGASIHDPALSARVALALRGLQTPRGAQPDPDGIEMRAQYESWKVMRSARRSSPNLK
jgi:hypothetical protein